MYRDDEYTTGGFGSGMNQENDTNGSDINENTGSSVSSDRSGYEEGAQAANLEFTAQVEINEARARAEAEAEAKARAAEQAVREAQDAAEAARRAREAAEQAEAARKAREEEAVRAAQAAEAARKAQEEAKEREAQDNYEKDSANTTYRYTHVPYSREDVHGDAGYQRRMDTGDTASDAFAAGGGQENAGSSAAGETADPVNADSPDVPSSGKQGGNRKKQKKKKAKNSSTGAGIAKFIGKCVAAAVIFGLVASLTFNGVNSLFGSSSGSSSGTTDTTSALVSNSSASGDASSSSSITVGTATALDVSDVVEEVMPAIVCVTSNYTETYSYGFGMDETAEYSSVGSGIIVAQTDDTLYIATNNHVVEDAESVYITFVDDAYVVAEIKGTDSDNDLAVLSVNISDMTAETLSAITVATLGDSDELEVGETTIAIGNALGYGQSVTTGIVSALNREVTIDSVTSLLIQTDAAINPGNSGGALLNASGEVIGINSAKYSDTDVEGMGYAIPINTAIPIINELIEKEKVSDDEASYLGIYGVDVTDDVSEYYSMPSGVYISQVVSGSAAEAAGIQAGDILTSFDGKTISTMEGLQSLMEYYAAGTEVEVVVQRANNGVYEEVTLTVTLGNKSDAP